MRPFRLSRVTAGALFLALCLALLLSGLAAGAVAFTQTTGAQAIAPDDTLVYVGTYTGPKSKGIYLFKLQTQNLDVSQNPTLVPLGLAAETPGPWVPESESQ